MSEKDSLPPFVLPGVCGLGGIFVGAVAAACFFFGAVEPQRRDWRNSYAKLKERYKTMAQLSAKEIDQLRTTVRARDAEIAALKSASRARETEKR